MSTQPGDGRRELLGRIAARRASIEAFLRVARPRGNLLINTAIISSAVAAVLTAAPGLGGETLTAGIANALSLPRDSYVWRTACILAMLVSIVAAISTNLARSQDTARRITAAEAVNAELEGLQTVMEFGQLPVAEAVKLYQQYIAKIPWVDEQPTPSGWSQQLEQGGPPRPGYDRQRPGPYSDQQRPWGMPEQQPGWGQPGPQPVQPWPGPPQRAQPQRGQGYPAPSEQPGRSGDRPPGTGHAPRLPSASDEGQAGSPPP